MATTENKLCVILAMRVDFFGKCLEKEYSGLGKKIQENLITVTADLGSADLIGAYLTIADLAGANLIGADLSSAYLYRANLTNANLTNAKNLTNSQIKSSCFWDQAIYKRHWDDKQSKKVADKKANQQYIEQLKQDKSSDPETPPDCSNWK